MVTAYGSQYVHTAWATDTEGTNFSTTAFDGATCIGTVTDDSSEEITDYSSYTWTELDTYVNEDEEEEDAEEEDTEENDELTDDDIETDFVETADITASDIPDSVDDDDAATSLAETVSELNNLKMAVSLQADSTTDQITNPNLISGTNSGADGWTASAGLTIEALSDTVYGDEAIDCLHITRATTDAATLFFASDDLSDAISYQAQSYTLSLDFRASSVVVMPISIATSDGATVGCTFDDIDYTDYADDYASVWVKYGDTATSTGDEATSEGIYIDLSNMAVGDTLDIANLKVETGSEQTPWRLSAKEADETADRKSVQANNLKCGTVKITPTAAGAVTSETIYFDKSFNTKPVVVCNPVSTRPDICQCAPSSISQDSFKLNFYRTDKTATSVNWFAFATS